MLKYRKFVENEDGLLIAAIVIILAMLVLIWFLSTLAANIVPVSIFLILIICLSYIIRGWLASGQGRVIRGASDVAREGGREILGLYDSAKREYRHRRK